MDQKKKREKTSHPNVVRYVNSGVYYYLHGGREISLKTKDEKEALRRIKFVVAKYEPLKGITLKFKLRDLRDPYLESRRVDFTKGKIRKRTLKETEDQLDKVLLPFFGKYQPAKVDSVIWEDFKARSKLRDLSNPRKVLSHFLKWCVKNRYSPGVPILEIDRPDRRQRRVLKPQEMRLIWDNCDGSLRLFVSMALFMGMRRTEIMTLEWRRINFEEKHLFLPKEITKTKKDRFVTLAPEAERLLVERLQHQQVKGPRSPWVFPNANDPKRHAHLDGLKTAWKTCKKRAGLEGEDITWHDLRATCEAYAHKRTDLTPTQLEKFFGASIDVQRKIYVQGDAEYVRGVEKTISLPEVTNRYGKGLGSKLNKRVKKALKSSESEGNDESE